MRTPRSGDTVIRWLLDGDPAIGWQVLLAMAGTHPFHRTTLSSVFPAERYERILDRMAWLTN